MYIFICGKMETGDFVKIDYIGRLESGEVFDLTNEEIAKKENIYDDKIKYKPATIVVGSGFIIKGLDDAIKEMKVGEKKTVVVHPKDGFGDRREDMIKTMPEKEIRTQVEPKPGMIIDFSGVKGRVQSVSSGRVTIDFNNPMAGKDLKYEIELLEKIDEGEDQIKSLLEFFGIEIKKVEIKESIMIEAPTSPPEIKKKISDIILKYVKSKEKIKKVIFTETYE